MTRVLWIDPGHRVGWATAVITDGRIENLRHGVTPLQEFALDLFYNQAGGGEPEYDRIGYETFRISKKHARDLIGSEVPTIQLVGMIRLIGWVSGATLVHREPAQKEAAFASMPAWIANRIATSNEQHDKDAAAHLWGDARHHFGVDPRA